MPLPDGLDALDSSSDAESVLSQGEEAAFMSVGEDIDVPLDDMSPDDVIAAITGEKSGGGK